MPTFKLRHPSGTALRAPLNYTLRGIDFFTYLLSLMIPQLIDGGNESSSGSPIDGNNESSSEDYVYDGMNEYGGFIVPNAVKTVGKAVTVFSMLNTVNLTGIAKFFVKLAIPQPIDGGDENSYGTPLDGNNEFSEDDIIYDGMNQDGGFIVPSNLSNVRKKVSVQPSLVSLINRLPSKLLTIITDFTTIVQADKISTSTLMELAVESMLSTQLLKLSYRSLLAAVVGSANTSKLVKTTTNAQIISISVYAKQVTSTFNISSIFNSNLSRTLALIKNIDLAVSYATSLVTVSSRNIRLAISSLFNPLISKQATRLVASDLTNLSNLSKAVGKTLSFSDSFSINLFTQSLRFVSLNILFSHNLSTKKAVLTTVNLNQSNNTSFTNLITSSVNASFVSSTSLFKRVYSQTSVIFNIATDIRKRVIRLLPASAPLDIDAFLTSSLFRALYVVSTFSSNITFRTSRLISFVVSSLFDSRINLRTSLNLSATYSNLINFSKAINRSIVLSVSNSINLFTQSLRFVSLNLLLGSSSATNKALTNTINLTETINPSFSSLITSSINIGVVNSVNFVKNVTKQISLTGQLIISFSKTIVKSIAVSVPSDIAASLTNYLSQALYAASTFSSNITFLTSRLISFVISSLFESNLSRRVNFAITTSFTNPVTFSKIVSASISLQITNSVSLFTQSLRFVSLNILSSFNISINRAINYSLSLSSTLSSSLSSNVFKFINTVENLSLSFNLIVRKFTNLTQNYSIAINRSIQYYFNITSTLITQVAARQLRFVSFAINSALQSDVFKNTRVYRSDILSTLVDTRKNVRKAISESFISLIELVADATGQIFLFIDITLETTLAKQIFKTFNLTSSLSVFLYRVTSLFLASLASLTSSLSISSTIFVKVTWSNILQTQKSIVVTINSFISLLSNYATTTAKTLSSTIILSSNVIKAVANTISLSILTLLNPSLSKASLNTLSIQSNFFVSFSKQINKFIELSQNFATVLLSLSLRLVNLSILSSFNSIVRKQTYTSINLLNSFDGNILKTTYSTVASGFTAFADFNKRTFRTIVLSSDLLTNVNKLVYFTLNATTDFINSIIKAISTSINFVSIFASSLVTASSRLISLAINSLIEPTVQKSISTNVRVISNLVLNISRSVAYFIRVLGETTTLLFTQSFRFVALNILSNQTLSQFVSVSTNINAFYTQGVNIVKNASITINDLLIESATQIQKQARISVQALVQLNLNILKTIAFNIKASVESSIRFIVSVFFKIQNATLFDSTILRVLSANITMAINNLFASTISSNVRISTNLISSLQTATYKTANILIDTSSYFSSMLLTQSFRFVYLSILNEFRTTLATRTSTLLSNQIELITNVSKRIFRATSINLITFSSISSKVSTFINQSLELIRDINKRTGKSIQINTSLVTSLTVRSLHLVTMALIQLFTAQDSRSTNLSIRLTKNLTIINQKLINSTLSLSTNLTSKIQSTISMALQSTFDLTTNLLKTALINLRANAQLIASFVTISLRFVRLAIIDSFNVANQKYVFKNIRFNLNLQTRLIRTFYASLEVILNLRTRRSHTFYSALTSFAVNKSKAGSEGSAQTMQRKSGGSAQKITTTNKGSTIFKRGETDDL